jgi:hypothetical protein
VRATEIRCPFCEHALQEDLDTRLVPLPPPPGLTRAELDGYRRSPRLVGAALASAAAAAIATSAACSSSSFAVLYGGAPSCGTYVPGVGDVAFGEACSGNYYAPFDSDCGKGEGYAVCDDCVWGYTTTAPAGFTLLDGGIPPASSACSDASTDAGTDGHAGHEAGSKASVEAGTDVSVEAGSDVSVDATADDSG